MTQLKHYVAHITRNEDSPVVIFSMPVSPHLDIRDVKRVARRFFGVGETVDIALTEVVYPPREALDKLTTEGEKAQQKKHIGLALRAMSDCEVTAYSTEEQYIDWGCKCDIPSESERKYAEENASIMLEAIYEEVSALWFNLNGGFYDFTLTE